MKLERKFLIRMVKCDGYQIEFVCGWENRITNPAPEITLVFDEATLLTHGITPSLDLVKKIIVCELASEEFPLRDEQPPPANQPKLTLHVTPTQAYKVINRDAVGDMTNAVIFESLSKTEVARIRTGLSGIERHTDIEYTLELHSIPGPHYRHAPQPSPAIQLNLKLTEEEYEECKALPWNTYFSIKFRVEDAPAHAP